MDKIKYYVSNIAYFWLAGLVIGAIAITFLLGVGSFASAVLVPLLGEAVAVVLTVMFLLTLIIATLGAADWTEKNPGMYAWKKRQPIKTTDEIFAESSFEAAKMRLPRKRYNV